MVGNNNVNGVMICHEGDKAYYILLHDNYIDNWNIVIELLEHENIYKVCYDIKLQIKILIEYNKYIKEPIGDPLIASWCLDPQDYEQNITLDKLLSKFNVTTVVTNNTTNKEELNKIGKETIETWLLMDKLYTMLLIEQLSSQFTTLEMPITYLCAQMEYYGVGFSIEKCKEPLKTLQYKLQLIDSDIIKCVGHPIDVYSNSELCNILYDKLQLPRGRKLRNNNNNSNGIHSTSAIIIPNNKKRKLLNNNNSNNNGNELYDTSAQYLSTISHLHELPNLIIEYRQLQQLIDKYIVILPKYVKYNEKIKMCRIISTISQTCSSTGRLSFINPNLQTIPHERIYKINNNTIKYEMRDSFKTTEDRLLIGVDYNSIELRVIAHFSQDNYLLNALQFGDDVFQYLATSWLNKQFISRKERDQCKSITYGY